MAAAIEVAQKDNRKVALVFLDLDHFKVINDLYGYAFGDKLLRTIAAKIKQSTGWDHLVARLGGDEFAVLVPRLQSDAALAQISQNVLQLLTETVRIEGFDASANASAGASVYPDDASTSAELLQHADLAMFSAKASGRNTYRRFSPQLAHDAKARGKLVNDLRTAVARKQFVVWYQPQLDLARHQLIGLEALVRWQHPTRGIVLPDEFNYVAEDQGLINDIGTYVTEQAIAQTARLGRRVFRNFVLAQIPRRRRQAYPAFIGGLPESTTDRSIVRALLSLTRDLRLRVVAEGIERPDQLSFLQAHGCPEDQGFLFSKALSAADVEARWLKTSAN